MAEAYRGLTIRIGGDVSGLTTALRTAERAVNSTASDIRKLNDALKLNPANMDAVTMKTGALANKATDLYSKLSTLKSGFDELSNTAAKSNLGNTIGDVAGSFDNVHMALQVVNEDYNALVKNLESSYRSITELSQQVGLDVVFNNKNNDLEEIRAAIDLIIEALPEAADKANGLYETVARLKPIFTSVRDELSDLGDADMLEKMKVDMVQVGQSASSTAESIREMQGLSSIGQSLEEANQRIQTLDVALEVAKEKFRNLDEALRLNPDNLELAEERMEALGDVTRLSNERIELLQNNLEAYRAAGIDRAVTSTKNVAQAAKQAEEAYAKALDAVSRLKSDIVELERTQRGLRRTVGESSEEYRKNAESIDETKRALKEAETAAENARKAMDTSHAEQEYQKLENTIIEAKNAEQQFGQEAELATNKAENAARGFTGVALTLATTLARYFSQASRAVTDAAREIDAAYRDLRKTTDATEAQYEALLDSAQRFSMTHVTSADQILEIEALGGQFGIEAEHLEEFAEAVSNIAVATDMSAEDAALRLGQMIEVLDDLNPDNVNNFADALVHLGNNFPATESTIMNIAQRISSIGGIAGMTTPEILAWSTALASTGQKSESAATALSNTIIQMQSAYEHGKDAMKDYADAVNIDLDRLYEAWETGPTEGLKLFIESLSKLGEGEEKESALVALEELGIDGIRQTQALLGLTQTVDTLNEALDASNEAWQGNGAASEEARKKAEGLSGKLSILENSLQVLAASLGDGLVPLVDIATDAVQGLVGVFSGLPDEVKTGIVAVGGLSTALTALTPILGILDKAGASFKKGFELVRDSLMGFTRSLISFGKSIPGVGGVVDVLNRALGPAGLLGTVGLLATAGVVLYNTYKDNHRLSASIAERTDTLRNALERTKPVIDRVDKSWQHEARSVSEMVDAAKDAYDAHVALAESIAETNESAQTNINRLGWAKTIIDEYANQSGLSADRQEQLKKAIEIVNAECGTQYSLVDALNGKIQDENGAYLDTTDAINEYIEAKQRAMQVDAYLTNQQNVFNQLIEDQTRYAEATQKVRELEEAGVTSGHEYYDALTAQSAAFRDIVSDTSVYNDLADSLYYLAGGEGDAAEEANHLSTNMTLVEGAFGKGSADVEGFMRALENAGISEEDFGRLSHETVQNLIMGYDNATGTIDGTREALEELGKAPTDVDVNVNVNGMDKARELSQLITNLPMFRNIDIRANYHSNRHENAAGGHVRRFATGAIFTGPTMTKHGLIGEAGAEYYDGDSIVPLTNTKYSKPFVDLLANGVVSRLGQNGNVYNIYFDNVRVNSDERITSAFETFMYEIARETDM